MFQPKIIFDKSFSKKKLYLLEMKDEEISKKLDDYKKYDIKGDKIMEKTPKYFNHINYFEWVNKTRYENKIYQMFTVYRYCDYFMLNRNDYLLYILANFEFYKNIYSIVSYFDKNKVKEIKSLNDIPDIITEEFLKSLILNYYFDYKKLIKLECKK